MVVRNVSGSSIFIPFGRGIRLPPGGTYTTTKAHEFRTLQILVVKGSLQLLSNPDIAEKPESAVGAPPVEVEDLRYFLVLDKVELGDVVEVDEILYSFGQVVPGHTTVDLQLVDTFKARTTDPTTDSPAIVDVRSLPEVNLANAKALASLVPQARNVLEGARGKAIIVLSGSARSSSEHLQVIREQSTYTTTDHV